MIHHPPMSPLFPYTTLFRSIDAKLGRVAAVEEPEDATLVRAGLLGGEHERRTLAEYRARYGDRVVEIPETRSTDRKSTRLNSSHVEISYAVFCLKKKIKKTH